ncbi:MAG: hypothetical protein NTY03_10705 [Candidatus Bathyarchaeota archaeon]|nr:hypothetical protein [Candidatus Bathyarchaeota archaeon]
MDCSRINVVKTQMMIAVVNSIKPTSIKPTSIEPIPSNAALGCVHEDFNKS